MKRVFLCALAFVFGASCSSTQVLRDGEYANSVSEFRNGYPDAALDIFPSTKETLGFITSVERAWIGQWTDPPFFPSLERESDLFDQNNYTSLTRETETFLFQESSDGYIPSEPEVVVLHLISAMTFMRQSRFEDAKVEARKAAFYLQSSTRTEKKFDDPALRIWLAGIWSALGEWQEAQVDLRRATELSGEPAPRHLAENAKPQRLSLIFRGGGPDLKWTEDRFAPEFQKPDSVSAEPIHFLSFPWYEWDLHRNTALRDSMLKSNYMARYLSVETGSIAESVATGVATAGAIVAGIAVALVLVGVAAKSGVDSGPMFEAAGDIAGGTAVAATDWNNRTQEDIEKRERQNLENLRSYRFVRFLPQEISLTSEAVSPDPKDRRFSVAVPGFPGEVEFVHRFEVEGANGRSHLGISNREVIRRADSISGPDVLGARRPEDWIDWTERCRQVHSDEDSGGT